VDGEENRKGNGSTFGGERENQERWSETRKLKKMGDVALVREDLEGRNTGQIGKKTSLGKVKMLRH